jgi:predicted DNA-binding transcriptional regulator AlpA/transposase
MPKIYPVNVRKFVLALLPKSSIAKVIEFTGVSRTSIWRWRKDVVIAKPRRKSKWDDSDVTRIKQMYKDAPSSTLAELKEALPIGRWISKSTVHNIVKQIAYTRKRLKKKRRSKNSTPVKMRAYRDVYNAMIADGADFMCQDESHFSGNILPLYGFSPKGETCYIESGDRTAYSLNFAFTRSGRYYYQVYEGSINGPRLQWFLDHVPPMRMILDNLNIHNSVKVQAPKVFTPVADPMANPAEIIFSKIKAAYRKINHVNRDVSVIDKIDRAIQTLTLEDFEGAIRHVHEYVNANY